MGAIQEGINNTLGTAGVLMGLSPEVKKLSEIRNINSQIKNLDKQAKLVGLEEGVVEKRNDLVKQKFELSPNNKTASEYIRSRPIISPEDTDTLEIERQDIIRENAKRQANDDYLRNTAYDKEYKRLQEANKQAQGTAAVKSAQKRDIKDYIKYKMDFYVDGERLDMSKASDKLVSSIAKQYNKEEIKRVMDSIDKKEKYNNGNN